MNIYLKFEGRIVGTFPLLKSDERSVMREVKKLQKNNPMMEVDYQEFQDQWLRDELSQYEDPSEVYGAY